MITVFTDLENKQAWKQCFTTNGIYLPTGYYLGMSAATGDLSDHHDIIGVRFYELENSATVSFVCIEVEKRQVPLVNLLDERFVELIRDSKCYIRSEACPD